MKNKSLDSAIRVRFWLSLCCSIALPVGIVGTVLSAVNLGTAISAICLGVFILCILLGFYGTPILWVSYGTLRNMKRLRHAIVDSRIYDMAHLSTHCNLPQKEVKRNVAALVSKGYMEGYTISGDYKSVVPLGGKQPENAPPKADAKQDNLYVVKCSGCGATYEVTASSRKCPYCGSFNK